MRFFPSPLQQESQKFTCNLHFFILFASYFTGPCCIFPPCFIWRVGKTIIPKPKTLIFSTSISSHYKTSDTFGQNYSWRHFSRAKYQTYCQTETLAVGFRFLACCSCGIYKRSPGEGIITLGYQTKALWQILLFCEVSYFERIGIFHNATLTFKMHTPSMSSFLYLYPLRGFPKVPLLCQHQIH